VVIKSVVFCGSLELPLEVAEIGIPQKARLSEGCMASAFLISACRWNTGRWAELVARLAG